jgi:small-conductance mechanosensitive channel
MTFVESSPLAPLIRHHHIMRAYLFITCLLMALTLVSLVDLFLVEHYLKHVKNVYVSPPLQTIIKLTLFIAALLPILHFVLRFNPLALVAIPTIASAGIAFALQDTLKAFIAGVGLGKIMRLNEWIAFQGTEGRVIDLNWARTTIETIDGQRVYIPNNLLLSGVFINYTTGNPANRQSFKVSASYDASPARVKEALLQCARFVPGIAQDPPPQAALIEYSDSGILYGLFYWLVDYTQKQRVQDDVATRIWYAFRREGITIPYPTRTVQIQRTADAGQSLSGIKESLQRWNLAEAFYAEELQELSRWT